MDIYSTGVCALQKKYRASNDIDTCEIYYFIGLARVKPTFTQLDLFYDMYPHYQTTLYEYSRYKTSNNTDPCKTHYFLRTEFQRFNLINKHLQDWSPSSRHGPSTVPWYSLLEPRAGHLKLLAIEHRRAHRFLVLIFPGCTRIRMASFGTQTYTYGDRENQ